LTFVVLIHPYLNQIITFSFAAPQSGARGQASIIGKGSASRGLA